jgi:hypothetical protein
MFGGINRGYGAAGAAYDTPAIEKNISTRRAQRTQSSEDNDYSTKGCPARLRAEQCNVEKEWRRRTTADPSAPSASSALKTVT